MNDPGLTPHHRRIVAQVWPRWVAWLTLRGKDLPPAASIVARRDAIRTAGNAGRIPTSFWRSAAEPAAFDLTVPDDWSPPAGHGKPTATPPGSRPRVEAMAARLARGEELFHPDDAGAAAYNEAQP